MLKADMINRMQMNDEIVKELKVYLNSSKFHNDTTVQVKDVLNRLADYCSYIPEFDERKN